MNRGALALRKWMDDQRATRTQAEPPVNDAWVAGLVGVHQTTVTRWLKGNDIRIEHARAVHRVTQIPVDWWAEPVSRRPSQHPKHA